MVDSFHTWLLGGGGSCIKYIYTTTLGQNGQPYHLLRPKLLIGPKCPIFGNLCCTKASVKIIPSIFLVDSFHTWLGGGGSCIKYIYTTTVGQPYHFSYLAFWFDEFAIFFEKKLPLGISKKGYWPLCLWFSKFDALNTV